MSGPNGFPAKTSALLSPSITKSRKRAPESLLLAVCPDSSPTWNDDLILAILEETLELTKIRTVDLDSVQKTGQILPALYSAFNLQGATVSTSFITAKEFISAAANIR